jgi:hypothetical protein
MLNFNIPSKYMRNLLRQFSVECKSTTWRPCENILSLSVTSETNEILVVTMRNLLQEMKIFTTNIKSWFVKFKLSRA